MERFLLLAVLSIVTFSVFQASDLPINKDGENIRLLTSKDIILKAQIPTSSTRSLGQYSIIGWKGVGEPDVVLEFMCSGDFLITISSRDNVVVYNHQLTLPSNTKIYKMTIPVLSYGEGTYTMTIEDVHSGKTTSGNFSVQ